jgi:hypothetical protein
MPLGYAATPKPPQWRATGRLPAPLPLPARWAASRPSSSEVSCWEQVMRPRSVLLYFLYVIGS